MNLVVLCGRLSADPISGNTASGKTYCNFTLAVNKTYGQDKSADFIEIVAWGVTAQNCAKYLVKGNQALVKGSITVDTFESNSAKIKKVRVLAESVEFLSRNNTQQTANNTVQESTFTDLTSLANDALPF